MSPFSRPAAVALAAPLLAYLNAKTSFYYDASLLRYFVGAQVSAKWHSMRDTLNMFYILEGHAQSRHTADHPFLIYEDITYTYKQAYEMALRFGNWLRVKYNVKPGEVVAMDFMNSANFVWIWMGLWSIGAKPAFINYNLGSTPLLHSIRTSTTRLVLVDPEVKDNFSETVMAELASDQFREGGGNVEVVIFDEMQEMEAHAAGAVRMPNEDRAGDPLHGMAILIYTSGTTGLPKPAIVSWLKCRLGGAFMGQWLPMTKKDVVYTVGLFLTVSCFELAILTINSACLSITRQQQFLHC